MKENMNEVSLISIIFFLHYRRVFLPFSVSSKHPLLFWKKTEHMVLKTRYFQEADNNSKPGWVIYDFCFLLSLYAYN